jgi:hypothetical protein
MKLDELKTSLQNARWFTRLGEFVGRQHMIPIRRREADGFSMIVYFDHPEGPALKVAWEWLPTTKDQPDPIHGDRLRALAAEMGKEQELRESALEIYKKTLTSLRNLYKNPLFKVGPHDETEAAKGGALYAARMASAEIVMNKPGFWCLTIPLYVDGYWPCGITEKRELLVF